MDKFTVSDLKCLCLYFFPVGEESFQADVGEGVIEHLFQHGRRYGGHIGADLGDLGHVQGMAQAGGSYLGITVVVVVNLANGL